MEFEIQFTDLTLLESNGNYDKTCEIMNKDIEETGAVAKRKDWMIRSRLTILSPFGFANMFCHFYNDGHVYIAEYNPSSKEPYNTDIKCLTYWCNEFGWKTPIPLPSVVDSWFSFWKKEWETYIVDSPYLDKKVGQRKEMYFDKDAEKNEDEEEDVE